MLIIVLTSIAPHGIVPVGASCGTSREILVRPPVGAHPNSTSELDSASPAIAGACCRSFRCWRYFGFDGVQSSHVRAWRRAPLACNCKPATKVCLARAASLPATAAVLKRAGWLTVLRTWSTSDLVDEQLKT